MGRGKELPKASFWSDWSWLPLFLNCFFLPCFIYMLWRQRGIIRILSHMSFVILQLSELHQDYYMSASFISASIFLTPTNLISSLVLSYLWINRPYWILIKIIINCKATKRKFIDSIYFKGLSRTEEQRKMYVHYKCLKSKIYCSNSSSLFLA